MQLKEISPMYAHLFYPLLGVLLLFLGRRLFWAFVAVVGFLTGMQFAPQLFPNESPWLVLAIGLATGLLGAILAIFLQQLAVVLAGFLAGGHLAMRFVHLLSWPSDQQLGLIFLVGGILGAILALLLLGWALIILSSLVGATLVTQALALDERTSALSFIILAAVGVVIQSRLFRRPVPAV